MGMLAGISSLKERLWQWFRERAHGTHAKAWLVAVSFSESSFFLVPPDVLLAAILLAGAERWAFYASLTTAASVAGGAFGYLVGSLFFDAVGERIVSFYGLGSAFTEAARLYDADAFLVAFAAAFTPIPYKIFVLAGGFLKADFLAFIAGSVLGRGLRFFAVAYIVRRFGEVILAVVMRYFNILTVLGVAAVAWWFLFR